MDTTATDLPTLGAILRPARRAAIVEAVTARARALRASPEVYEAALNAATNAYDDGETAYRAIDAGYVIIKRGAA
jgi:hypothetical protein